jgi:hypothetical protein
MRSTPKSSRSRSLRSHLARVEQERVNSPNAEILGERLTFDDLRELEVERLLREAASRAPSTRRVTCDR